MGRWSRPCCTSLFFQNISARRILQGRVLEIAHRRGRAFRARSGGEPGGPVGPPAALVALGALQPLLRAARRGIADYPCPVSAFAARRIDDPCNMAAGGAHVPHVAAEQLRDTPRTIPWHDVVLLGADRVGVEANAAEIDGLALKRDCAGPG